MSGQLVVRGRTGKRQKQRPAATPQMTLSWVSMPKRSAAPRLLARSVKLGLLPERGQEFPHRLDPRSGAVPQGRRRCPCGSAR